MTELLALPEFDKDVKKISKKYQSLHDDLDRLYKALKLIRLNDIRGTVRISDLGEIYKDYPVYKLKSFRCASLHHKGANSGIRVIYYDDEDNDEITLIELYCKSQQENETRSRIYRFLDDLIKDGG